MITLIDLTKGMSLYVLSIMQGNKTVCWTICIQTESD